MKTGSRLHLGRLLSETAVIVVGITLGLAADRWVSGMDERDRAAAYVTELIANLAADSATLHASIRTAEDRQRFAVDLLDARVDSLFADPEAFLARLETLSWWAPVDHSRETWDDLVATGGLGLIRDQSLRLALSRYYNTTETLATIEDGWERQMLQAAQYRLEVLAPLQRLAVVGAIPDGARVPSIGAADAESAFRALQADTSAMAGIGNIALIYSGQRGLYGVLLDQASAVLTMLRGAL